MISTGIVRQMDEKARITLPAGLRKSMELDLGDEVEFSVRDGGIAIKKHEPYCVFCHVAMPMMYYFFEHYVCIECVKSIKGVRLTRTLKERINGRGRKSNKKP